MPRPGAAVVVLALLALPVAVADHAYSHQYRVFGRVVDADGAPVAGAVVVMRFAKNAENVEVSFRTDCTGDYGYGMMEHFHVHELSTVAEVHAAVLEPADPEPLAETSFSADRDLRKTRLDWRLDRAGPLAPCEDGPARVASTAFVYGRLWNATREHRLEGHLVWGEVPGGCRVENRTAPCQPVEVAVTTPEGARANATAWSNPYGDYAARLDLGAAYRDATADVRWLDRVRTVPVDPVLHTAEVDLLEGEPRRARAAPGADALAVLALAAAALLARKVSA